MINKIDILVEMIVEQEAHSVRKYQNAFEALLKSFVMEIKLTFSVFTLPHLENPTKYFACSRFVLQNILLHNLDVRFSDDVTFYNISTRDDLYAILWV